GMWFAQGGYTFGGGGVLFPPKDDPSAPAPQKPNFEEGIAAMPVGAMGLGSGDVYVRGFHISARTQQAQACWEWLKFMSADTSPGNLQVGTASRRSVAQSEAFTKQAMPGQAEIYKAY